jgi:cell division septation protein DedD
LNTTQSYYGKAKNYLTVINTDFTLKSVMIGFILPGLSIEEISMAKGTKKSSKLNIEMDTRGFFLFALLLVLTGAVLFYLGITVGKSMRNPDRALPQTPPAAQTALENDDTLKDLAVFDMKEQFSSVKDLEKSFQEITERSKTQDTKPTEPTKQTAATEKPKTQPKAEPKKAEKLYTIQVLATRNKDNANKYVRMLKNQSYDAYLQEVNVKGSNSVMYRVRVGRMESAEAKETAKELSRSVKGLGKLTILELAR